VIMIERIVTVKTVTRKMTRMDREDGVVSSGSGEAVGGLRSVARGRFLALLVGFLLVLSSSSISVMAAVDPKKVAATRRSQMMKDIRNSNMMPKMKDGKVVPADPADVVKVAKVKEEMAAEKAKEMATGDTKPVAAAAGETEADAEGKVEALEEGSIASEISEVEAAVSGEESSSANVNGFVANMIEFVDVGGGRDSPAMDSVIHALDFAKVAKVNKTFVSVPQDNNSLGNLSDSFFHFDLDEEGGMLVIEIEYEPEEEEDQDEAKVESELSDDEGCGLPFCGFEHISTKVEVVEELENDLANGFSFASFFNKLGIYFDTKEESEEKEGEDGRELKKKKTRVKVKDVLKTRNKKGVKLVKNKGQFKKLMTKLRRRKKTKWRASRFYKVKKDQKAANRMKNRRRKKNRPFPFKNRKRNRNRNKNVGGSSDSRSFVNRDSSQLPLSDGGCRCQYPGEVITPDQVYRYGGNGSSYRGGKGKGGRNFRFLTGVENGNGDYADRNR
jgi:hypothetical protein